MNSGPLLDEDASMSLSFSYGYCAAVTNEFAKEHEITPPKFKALSGHERSFSAGAFAGRQDLRMKKYDSLSALSGICRNLKLTGP